MRTNTIGKRGANRSALLRKALIPLLIAVIAILVLIVVSPRTQPSTSLEGTAGFAPELRDQPTLAPPAWVEASEEVTLENAPRIAYIGRLDTTGTPSTVFSHALSPDGTRLAGLNNEQLIGWDLINGQILFTTARQEAHYVFYGTEKTEIYTLDEAGTVLVYDADTGKLKDSLSAHPQFNGSVAYDADNGWLALGGFTGEVKVWNPGTRESLVTFSAGGRGVRAVALSTDGERLATANDDGAIHVWDWRNKTSLSQFQGEAVRMAFSPDGAQLAVGLETKIDVWNLSDGTLAYSLATGPGSTSDILIYSADGAYLLNGGAIPSVTLWDTATGRLVNTLPGVGGDRTSAAFSPGGELLATSVLGGAVVLWDMSTIRQEVLNQAQLAVGTRQMIEADWSNDGYLLLLFDATGPIQVWGIPPAPEEQ